jgi:hypothetical protein
MKVNREAFLVRESVEGGLKGDEALTPRQFLIRRHRRDASMASNGSSHGNVLMTVPTSRRSSAFTKHVPSNGTKPGPESSAVFDGVEFAVGTDENLLSRVFGIGRRTTRSTEAAAATQRKH